MKLNPSYFPRNIEHWGFHVHIFNKWNEMKWISHQLWQPVSDRHAGHLSEIAFRPNRFRFIFISSYSSIGSVDSDSRFRATTCSRNSHFVKRRSSQQFGIREKRIKMARCCLLRVTNVEQNQPAITLISKVPFKSIRPLWIIVRSERADSKITSSSELSQAHSSASIWMDHGMTIDFSESQPKNARPWISLDLDQDSNVNDEIHLL
jgi:hypothetical protein